jgi:signal transduction histidine kinase
VTQEVSGMVTDRAIDSLVLEIVHELRQPLTVASLSAQVMLRRRVYDAEGLRVIVEATDRIKRLIADLSDAPSDQTGAPILRRTETDLVRLAAASIDGARVLTSAHALRLEAPVGPVIGWWDRGRIEQVLATLVDNAIKHTRGGEVVVRVEPVADAARVLVRDRGPGVPPEALPRLFERAYRAVPAVGAPPGQGLGLYLCKSLVEAHGGRLWVESTPGRGSTFAFELPRSPPSRPA